MLGVTMGSCDLTTGGSFVDVVRGGGLPVGLMCWLLLLFVSSVSLLLLLLPLLLLLFSCVLGMVLLWMLFLLLLLLLLLLLVLLLLLLVLLLLLLLSNSSGISSLPAFGNLYCKCGSTMAKMRRRSSFVFFERHNVSFNVN